MEDIGKSVKKVDHDKKAAGVARYIGDVMTKNLLYAKVVRSTRAGALIKSIEFPELPEGYRVISWRDVPGENVVHVVEDDMPIFAVDRVEYIGEPIVLIVGPDKSVLYRLCEDIVVQYWDLPSILSLDNAEEVFYEEGFSYGDVDGAFECADLIFEEDFTTGHQEHAYLETQGIIAEPIGDRMVIQGSMQCPYYIYYSVAKALGVEKERVRVIQTVTGGGFGGKEDYPSVLAVKQLWQPQL